MKLLKITILVALLAFYTCQEKLFDDDASQCNSTSLIADNSSPGGKGPSIKPNKFKKFGSGNAAYFYDHLDYLFKKKLAEKFKKIYNAASETKFEMSADIYSEEILKSVVVQGREFNDQVGFEKYLNDFNKEAYQKAIRFPQLVEFMKTAKWYREETINFDKNSFDKFDFNGDGRLDHYEFILFSIVHNIRIFGKGQCVEEHCYDDIFKNLIDPIFDHANCPKSDTIDSEEIWNALKQLKKPEADKIKYSLFSCSIRLDMIKEYRTISVNDFVLISDWDHSGLLNENEFRTGILLGYWSRQVKPTQIYDDNEINGKKERWNEDGTMDKMCEQIKKFLPEYKPQNANSPKSSFLNPFGLFG